MKKLLGLIGFLAAAILITTAIVIYAMGYRPNLSTNSIQATGVVSIKSIPTGAKVFIDGKSQNNTDVDIPDLSPGTHVLKIIKNGFAPWEKTLTIKKEKVNILQIYLFTTTPSFSPTTSIGVVNPTSSPKGDRIFFQSKTKDQAGIWSLSLNGNNLTSFFSKELNQIVSDDEKTGLIFSDAAFEISPNGSQILVKLPNGKYYLLDTAKFNDKPGAILDTEAQKTSSNWESDRQKDISSKINSLGKNAQEASIGLKEIKFSPDKSKLFGFKESGELSVFDSKASLYSGLEHQTYTLPTAKKYLWYTDNVHLVVIEDSSISIVDLNGGNKTSIFTGAFDSSFLAVWPNGSKIAMLANFNKTPSSLPNIYAIQLR